jgi:DNA modification methylase
VLVLDPFGGSGSTLIACEKTGRQARLVELDPRYCDVMVRRWQDWTGKAAVLESGKRMFEEIAAGVAPAASEGPETADRPAAVIR